MKDTRDKGKYIVGSNPDNKYKFKGNADYISTARLADAISKTMVEAGADPDIKIPMRLCIRKNANSCFGNLTPDGRVNIYTGAISNFGKELKGAVPEISDRIDAVLFTTLYTAALVESLKPDTLAPGGVRDKASDPEFMFARRNLAETRRAYDESPAYDSTGDKNSIFTLMQGAKRKANIFGEAPIKGDAPEPMANPDPVIMLEDFKPKKENPATGSRVEPMCASANFMQADELLDFGDGLTSRVEESPREKAKAVVSEVNASAELDGLLEIEPEPEDSGNAEVKDKAESKSESEEAAPKDTAPLKNIKPAPKARADELVDLNALMEGAERIVESAPEYTTRASGMANYNDGKTTGRYTKHDIASHISEVLDEIL